MIDFMRFKKLYFAISGLVLVPGIASLLLFGLTPSIDFTGGALFEVEFKKPPESREILEDYLKEKGIEVSSVQETSPADFLLKMKPISESDKNGIKNKLEEKFGDLSEVRFEMVGPALGHELLVKTLIAVVLAAGFILAYIAYQFRDKMYGVCAILAMFHDTFVLLGSFSLLGRFLNVEVDTLFVTALLTVLSFSVHDTVVVFDRIRESIKLDPKADFESVVNRAVNETLIRSLNNSLTIIFMLLSLVLLGGPTIRWFAVALLVGTISGTYSSPFTAAPLLLVWRKLKGQ